MKQLNKPYAILFIFIDSNCKFEVSLTIPDNDKDRKWAYDIVDSAFKNKRAVIPITVNEIELAKEEYDRLF